MSAGIHVDVTGEELLQRRLGALSNAQLDKVLAGVGALVESQTKRRLQTTKASPDGTKWAPWSPRYARTRHGRQSLLQSTNHLLLSIQPKEHDVEVEVGSNLRYARAQQEGNPDRHLPARPYLGLSDQDEHELLAHFEEWVDDALGGALV